MSILPVAVVPTRSVFTSVDIGLPFRGYGIIRYQNVQGSFSLTTLTYADVFKPPDIPGNPWVQLGFSWRAIVAITSFDPIALGTFGGIKKRRRYGYYQCGYADLDASLHYINFDKQLTNHYTGFVNENGFASWVDVFPPPLPSASRIYDAGNINVGAGIERTFATLIKGELTQSVIADIYISASYNWVSSPDLIPFAFVDV